MIYGDAVRMDGGEISLNNRIDGELGLNNGIDGAEVGVFYNRGGAVGDYPALSNKPSINGVTVLGDKLGEDYRLQRLMDAITAQDIDDILYGGL